MRLSATILTATVTPYDNTAQYREYEVHLDSIIITVTAKKQYQ